MGLKLDLKKSMHALRAKKEKKDWLLKNKPSKRQIETLSETAQNTTPL